MKTNFKKMFAVTIALSVLCFGFTDIQVHRGRFGVSLISLDLCFL